MIILRLFSYFCSRNHFNMMDYDIHKSVSQGSDGAQDAENSRIAAIANELHRLCQLHEAQSGTGQTDVTPFEREQRMAEQMAKAKGFWIPTIPM